MDGGTAQVEIGDDGSVMLVGEVTAVFEGTLSNEIQRGTGTVQPVSRNRY